MPTVVAPVVAATGTIVGASSVLSFVAKVVVSVAVSMLVNKVFAKKPAQQDFGTTAQNRTLTVRQPAQPRRLVYGRQRVGGTLVFMQTSDASTSVQVVEQANVPPAAPFTLTASRAASFVASVEVHRVTYTVDFAGNQAEQRTTLTATTGTPAAGEYAVTSGGVYTFHASDAGSRVELVYTHRQVTAANYYMHLVVVLAAHECEAVDTVYLDDQALTLNAAGNDTGRFGSFVRVKVHLGEDGQAADSDLMAECPAQWTSAHRLRGHTYLYVRLSGSANLYPNGIPNISAVVRGKNDIHDPRDGSTGYSTNPALCLANWLMDDRHGFGCELAEIDTTALAAAANTCDESVDLADATTESRYTCNGTVDTAAAPEQIIPEMLSAMAGSAVFTGGLWVLSAGAYTAPTITLDEDDCRGEMKVMPRLPRRELFNAVKGLYTDPDQSWQPVDYPVVTSATYQAEDAGERIFRDIDLAYTTSGTTAQRLARIVLERGRRGLTCLFPARLSALQLRAGDTVMLDNDRMGWSAKVFEVQEWQFAIYDDDGAPALGVDLVLREVDANAYAWTTSDEQPLSAAPRTRLPPPLQVLPPGTPQVTEELYEGRNGVSNRVTVSWAPSADVLARSYGLEYKLASAATWTPHVVTTATSTVIADLAAGTYDFRVQARNDLGVTSPWSQARAEVLGLAAAPSAVTGLSLQAAGGLAILTWDLHPDLDVRVGGRIRVRHDSAESGATWETSVSIGNAVSGSVTVAVVPLRAGTYLVKAEDSTGQLSSTAATFSTREALLLSFSTLSTLTEHTTFTGAKTNVTVSGGVLKLDSAADWDSLADIDAVTDIDAAGGVELSGTYEFATGMDLTTVKTVRLTPVITVTATNVLSNVDQRTTNIDTWEDFDGTAGGAMVDAVLEVRQTDDDPAGTPTWTGWGRLDAAERNARAFEFRLQLTTDDPAYNIEVSALSVSAREAV